MRQWPILPAVTSRRTSEQSRWLRSIAATLTESLPSNSAILDEKGIIRLTNRAWRQFGRSNKVKYPEAIGINYLDLADAATGYSSECAREASNGIRAVLKGRAVEFAVDYPCHSPERQRWFRMRATPLDGLGPLRVVLSHQDIAAERFAETRLFELERELKIEQTNLEMIKTSLKVMLQRRKEDRREIEEKVLANISELVNPYIEKLRKSNLDPEQRECLAVIQTNLQGVISPFLSRLSSRYFNLTSQEFNVAHLVVEGRGTKEIADVLGVSTNAVEFHRKNIRKKLGISNKRVSLRSRLLSLEPSCMYQQFHAWKSDRRR